MNARREEMQEGKRTESERFPLSRAFCVATNSQQLRAVAGGGFGDEQQPLFLGRVRRVQHLRQGRRRRGQREARGEAEQTALALNFSSASSNSASGTLSGWNCSGRLQLRTQMQCEGWRPRGREGRMEEKRDGGSEGGVRKEEGGRRRDMVRTGRERSQCEGGVLEIHSR